ncbi:MAG TPA: hypothetical protein VJC13_03700 [Candidatus Paceibacterota bacterium]
MSLSDKLYNIVAGPNKWDLITAFGNAYGGINPCLTIEFQYFTDNSRIKFHLKTTIYGLEHESGSGESWNFKGIAEMPNGKKERIKGYYSTQSRNGHFKIFV